MLTLPLGGARSGKSALAESMAAPAGSPVTFVATRPGPPGDVLGAAGSAFGTVGLLAMARR